MSKVSTYTPISAADLDDADELFVAHVAHGASGSRTVTVEALREVITADIDVSAENVIYVSDTGDAEDNGAALMAARTAAASGDTIHVRPGTYTLPLGGHQLGKNGVNYHFENGAVVQVDDTSTAVAQADRITGFFDDSSQGHGLNAQLVCRVTGHAKFRWHIAPVTVVEGPAMFRVTRSDSNVHLEFDEVVLDETSLPISAHYYYVFGCEGGVLFARGNYVYRQAYVPVVWWKNGQTFIDVNHIQNLNTTSLPSTPALGPAAKDANTGATPTGFLWVRAQQIDGHLTSTGSGKHSSSTMWVECQQLRGTLLQNHGGKVYVKCQKWLLELDAVNYGISQVAGTLWLEADKVTAGTTLAEGDSTKGWAELGGESYIHVRQWEDQGISDVTSGELRAVHVFGGTHYLTTQVLSVTTPSAEGDLDNFGYAVAVSGSGTLHWQGRVHSTDPKCNGFLVEGSGSLRIDGGSCVLAGSTNSLYAASAKNVYLYGTLATNKDKHANVTVKGDTAGFVFSATDVV